MKKYFLSAVSLAALSVHALAADLPSRKAPIEPLVAAPLWTGFYAGLNAGYGWGTNSNTSYNIWQSQSWVIYDATGNSFANQSSARIFSPFLGMTSPTPTQSGFIGGGQIGYNYKLQNNVILGLEADIQGTTTRGQSYSTIPSVSGATASSGVNSWAGNSSNLNMTTVAAGLDYLGTVRGRIGYLLQPSMLIYGTAGLAYGGAWADVSMNTLSTISVTYNNSTLSPPNSPFAYLPVSQGFLGRGNNNMTLVGYSAGGGVEWMFAPSWSLKLEGLYYNLGTMNITTSAFSGQVFGPAIVYPLNTTRYIEVAQPSGIAGSAAVNFQGIIARAGVNYHFNLGSAPVVAKF